MKKIAFVHIPKNAGTTVKKVLSQKIHCTNHNTQFDFLLLNKFEQLIIIRDPISRFISSVNYTINNSAYELLDDNLLHKSPNDWADILFDKNHYLNKYVADVMAARKNYDLINNQPQTYRWHWSPQYLWVHSPQYVILYENLELELTLFCKKYFNLDIKLKHHNRSYGPKFLTEKNQEHIYNFYRQDQILYNLFKSIHIDDRLLYEQDPLMWLIKT